MVRQAFLILLALTALAFWLQITWLYVALGVLLVALLIAQSMATPQRRARPIVAAPAPRPQQRQVIVVQQPAQKGPGFFDIFMGMMMAGSFFAKSERSPFMGPARALDKRLASIEGKLGGSDKKS